MRSVKAFALMSAVLILAGCSGGSGSGSAGSGLGSDQGGQGATTIGDALRLMPPGGHNADFGDLAGARKADGGDGRNGPFAFTDHLAASELAVGGAGNGDLARLTGIDLAKVTVALDFGDLPDDVGVLYGSFDTKAIGAKLSALGYKSSKLGTGETAWILRDDHRESMDDALGQIGIFSALNVIHLSSGRLVYGQASSALARLSAGGSLADDPVFAGLAGCLGDAKAAAITTDARAWPGLFGYGVSGDAQNQNQVLCVTADSDAAAHTLAQAWPAYIASALMAKTGAPWSSLMSGVGVTYVGGAGHVVRLTAHGARADLLYLAIQSGDFPSLFPGSSGGS